MGTFPRVLNAMHPTPMIGKLSLLPCLLITLSLRTVLKNQVLVSLVTWTLFREGHIAQIKALINHGYNSIFAFIGDVNPPKPNLIHFYTEASFMKFILHMVEPLLRMLVLRRRRECDESHSLHFSARRCPKV